MTTETKAAKYVEQYDLPEYPNAAPRPHARLVCGIQQGNSFDPAFTGYTLWVGGTGGWKFEGTLQEARVELHRRLVERLEYRVAGLMAQLTFYQGLRVKVGVEERELVRFQVPPE